LDLFDGLANEPLIRRWIEQGAAELVGGSAVPVGHSISEVRRSDFEQWFHTRQDPRPETFVTEGEIRAEYHWDDAAWQRAARLGFPKPIQRRIDPRRNTWTPLYRHRDVQAWTTDIATLKGIK
jgi:hypothetical protein